MKLLVYILLFSIGVLAFPGNLIAQEEESAAISTEENSDEFQENFFEALKQKGIENYDKAINLFLECKRLDPDNPVVDYELARTYNAIGEPMSSIQYGITALNADPTNMWYLETIVIAALQQGNTIDIIKERIPYGNTVVKENLAKILYRRNDYEAALRVLSDLRSSVFTEQLSALISDSARPVETGKEPEKEASNPMESYRQELQEMLEKETYGLLDEHSLEALESFPSFPYFYYIRGMVLIHKQQFQEASSILEEGLNYLLDDRPLEENFYKALAKAYTAMGNTSKANMYLNKIKSGS